MKTFLHYIVFVLALILFYFYQKGNMFITTIASGYLENVYAPILLVLIALCYNFSKIEIKTNGLYYSLLCCFILIILIAYMHSVIIPLSTISLYVVILLPILLFKYIYIITNRLGCRISIISFSIVFFMLLFYYIKNYNANLYDINTQENSSYTLLYLFPLLLCYKNRLINYIAFALMLFVMMLSLKRGGLISLGLGALSYIICYNILISRKKINIIKILLLVIFIGFLIVFFNYIDELQGGLLSKRILNLQDDEGSGRIPIFEKVYSMFLDSSIENKLLGNGWNSVIRENPLGYSAHNDFLEVLYNFGILAFVAYIFMIARLLYVLKSMIKRKSIYAPVFMASVVFFLVNSMVSHIIVYTYYMSLFVVVWAVILVADKQQSNNKNDYEKNNVGVWDSSGSY